MNHANDPPASSASRRGRCPRSKTRNDRGAFARRASRILRQLSSQRCVNDYKTDRIRASRCQLRKRGGGRRRRRRRRESRSATLEKIARLQSRDIYRLIVESSFPRRLIGVLHHSPQTNRHFRAWETRNAISSRKCGELTADIRRARST